MQRGLLRRVILYSLMILALSVAIDVVLLGVSDLGSLSLSWKTVLWNHGGPLLAVGLLLPLFQRDMAAYTARFLGPVNRLRSALHSEVAGDCGPPLDIRESDFWQDLADDFNLLVKQHRAETRQRPLESSPVESSESLSA